MEQQPQMKIGMLWFDNSKRSIEEKLDEMANYYHKKYGRRPTLIWVNPKTKIDLPLCNIPEDWEEVLYKDIKIRKSVSILSGHYWIGMETEIDRKKGKNE
jgi:hypothetical protein